MSISRTKAREEAMTILYQINLYEKNKIKYEIEELLQEKDEFNK